jgi:hypothetical protein
MIITYMLRNISTGSMSRRCSSASRERVDVYVITLSLVSGELYRTLTHITSKNVGMLDPIETVNVNRLHAINNISCFLHYFGVQIFKLNNIAFLYSHPSYDKALDLETVVEYDIQGGGSSCSRARGCLDGGSSGSNARGGLDGGLGVEQVVHHGRDSDRLVVLDGW